MRTALALCLAVLPCAAAAQWALEGELARHYDDNLSRAQLASDVVGDRALTLRGALGRGFVLADGDLALRAEVRAARYDGFTGLDHAALGLVAAWRRKLGLGLTAPWLGLDASVFREDHAEQVRDADRGAAGVTLGRRFDERFEASLGVAYDWRRQLRPGSGAVPGISDRPFSLQGRSVALRGSFALSERLLLFGGVGLRRGDVVSSTRRNLQIFRASLAIASDPAFGPDFVAYALSGARTASYSLGASWALGRRLALDAAVSADRTRARGGLDYDGNVYSLSLVYRE